MPQAMIPGINAPLPKLSDEELEAQRQANLVGQAMIDTTPAPVPVSPQPAPMAAAAPQPLMPSVAPTPMVQETTIEKTTPNAAFLQGAQNLGKTFEEQKNIEAEKAKIQEAKALEENKLKQQGFDRSVELEQKIQSERDNAIKEAQEDQDRLNKQVDEYRSQKYEGFWATRGTGNKILGAIAVGLGSYGASLTGGKNYALDIINKAMDDDFANYKQSMDQKLQAIEQSKLSIASKAKLRQQVIENGIAYKLAQTDQVQQKLGLLGGKYVSAEAKNNLAALNNSLDAQKAKMQMDINEAQNTKTTTKIAAKEAKALQEWQVKDRLYGERMSSANQTMDKLYSQNYDAASMSGAFDRSKPNALKSKEAQMQEQAERNFLNAVLRRESGASISESEFESGSRQYFPRFGDSPEVLEQKRQNRQQVTNSFLGISGGSTPMEAATAPTKSKQELKRQTNSKGDIKVIYTDGTEEIIRAKR
jgi:hypothetical protein